MGMKIGALLGLFCFLLGIRKLDRTWDNREKPTETQVNPEKPNKTIKKKKKKKKKNKKYNIYILFFTRLSPGGCAALSGGRTEKERRKAAPG